MARFLQACPGVDCVVKMPALSQSFASSPPRVRNTGTAQAAVAQAVLEKPRVEALFPQMEPSVSSPAPPRALSRASRSEPLMPSPFGRANASELSVATTAFIPPSHLWGGAGGGASPERTNGEPDALTTALADAAVAAAASPSASPAPPGRRTQTQFQASLPYRTETESSVVSDWRLHYWRDGGKGVALARGLRFHDLRDATANTPGVCVLKQGDDLPKMPGRPEAFGPTAEKDFIIRQSNRQLLQMGVELIDQKEGGLPAERSSGGGTDSREVPRQQALTAGRRQALASAGSEASLASLQERRKNLASVIARERYQSWVVARPKKGHRFVNPDSPT